MVEAECAKSVHERKVAGKTVQSSSNKAAERGWSEKSAELKIGGDMREPT